jgi:Fe-S-cluster containining protein
VTYRQLLGDLDEWFAEGVAHAGHEVVLCRRGCSTCCNGPFDISAADAELVGSAVDRLPAEVAAQVRSRALDQISTYHDAAPWWQSPWNVDILDEEYFDRLSEQLAHRPCPALGDEGNCLIYDNRPATCRMIGLPLVKPDGGVLENNCPILHTSRKYAELNPTLFDLEAFELAADGFDADAMTRGWVSTTVAGAVAREKEKKRK